MKRRSRWALGAGLAALALVVDATGSTRTASAPARASAVATTAAASAAAAPVAAVEFNGLLEAGTTYVAEMAYDPRALRIWRPVKEVSVAKNVAWTIDWINIDRFPHLKIAATQAKPQRFSFTVVKNDIVSGSPALPWMSTYRCEILAVEPVAAPGPAAPPAKKR